MNLWDKYLELRRPHTKPLQLNKYWVEGDTIEVLLNRDIIILISKEDENILKHFSFYVNRIGYAKTTVGGKKYFMSRMIAGDTPGMHVDHINGDTLDNRRQNLRLVSPQINSWNRHSVNTSTGVLGVSKHSNGSYYGRIGYQYKIYCTKNCKTLAEAEKLLIKLRKEVYDKFKVERDGL